MRTQLFRKTVLVDGTAVVAALMDVDGVDPLTLVVENMDVAASGRTKFGSKNANLRFVAVLAGTHGNGYTVTFHAAAGQAFSIVDGAPYGFTVNLKCDASGKPIQLASEVMDLLNAEVYFAGAMRTVLSKGSDGSATLEVAVGTDVVVNLTGGAAAVTLGAALVEVSPRGLAPRPLSDSDGDFPGPWITDTAAGSALSSVAAGTAKSYVMRSGNTAGDAPFKGLRVSLTKGGGGNTTATVTGIVTKKGGGVS